MRPKPWGKIFVILLLSAAVMGVFVWKYLETVGAEGDGVIGHVPTVLKPLYDLFEEKLYLVLGGVASLLFAAGGIRAVAGKSDWEASD